MTTPPAPEPPVHLIVGFTQALSGALDRVLVREPAFLSADEQRETLIALARQRARLEALELKVLAAADREQVGSDSGAASTGAWLAHVTLADRSEVAAKVRLARALDEDRSLTWQGLAAGDHSVAHAAVIVRALADLPGGLDAGLMERAEKTLVEEARHLTPKQLRTVGQHLLEVVAPEAAEAKEKERLDRQDAAAFAKARLTMRANGDGTTQGWFRLPDLHAQILKSAVEAVIAPRKSDRAEPDPDTGRLPDHATRMGHGFCEVLEHLPTEPLGQHGGVAATVVVTLDLDMLRSGLGSAAFAEGASLSAGEVRRLACNAGLIPAVLGRTSSVLDLGRESRLFSKAQRIAMGIRDQGCRAETCDRPPSWCEAHHLTSPWSKGGKTDLADGVLLCGHHHRLAHHPDYDHTRLPNGDLRFHRRT